MYPDELTTVFRSPRRRECEERLLVLTAMGVEGVVTHGVDEFLVQVAVADADQATRHLRQYEAENRPVLPAAPPPRVYRFAWVGCGQVLLLELSGDQ